MKGRRPSIAGLSLAALALLVGLGVWLGSAPSHAEEPVRTPLEHRRPADQTYLTFPEWYLVHSPRELADWTAEHSPSGFPWMTTVIIIMPWWPFARLGREIDKLAKELARVRGKLDNASFVERAPPEVVTKERDKLAAQEQALEKLQEQEQRIRQM